MVKRTTGDRVAPDKAGQKCPVSPANTNNYFGFCSYSDTIERNTTECLFLTKPAREVEMKKVIWCFAVLGSLLFASLAFSDEPVRGYTRHDGTYVQPYHRSSPDRTPTNNYDFKGNTNPWTVKEGTNPYRDNPKSPYYDGSQPKPKNLFD